MLLATVATPAMAQSEDVEELQRQLAAQEQRIERLEALVERQSAVIEGLTNRSVEAGAATGPHRAGPDGAALASQAVAPQSVVPNVARQTRAAPAAAKSELKVAGLDLYGDARVRQELNFSDSDGRNRGRTVVRARIGANYQATPDIAFGARLVTGDLDDPNTADVTLGDFVDDIPIGFDRVWVRYQAGRLTAYAGKFPQIFNRTDMVWDGDVSPQGAGLSYSAPLGDGASIGARGMYFIVDEAAAGPDSVMLGGQGVLSAGLTDTVTARFAAGYYDYDLNDLSGANAGDFRGNLIANGRYLSDFRLLDLIAEVRFGRVGKRWPLALSANYVRNLGAAVRADTGFALAAALGQAQDRGDWRVGYNYSEVEADAVFAAFSHDNLTISTNYALHGLTVDHTVADDLVFTLNWYHYRPLDPVYTGAELPGDWLDRVRLNLAIEF